MDVDGRAGPGWTGLDVEPGLALRLQGRYVFLVGQHSAARLTPLEKKMTELLIIWIIPGLLLAALLVGATYVGYVHAAETARKNGHTLPTIGQFAAFFTMWFVIIGVFGSVFLLPFLHIFPPFGFGH